MRLQPIKSRWLTWSKTWFAHLSSYTLYYFFRLTNQGRHQGWNGAGYSPARCSYLSFDLWLPTKRLMIALNSTTQGIALFPESISGNSATRCYISDNYSIITERRYIKICNHMYFLTRNILAQILFLSDVRFRRYLTIDKITLLTTRIPHFVNCQISSEP